MDLGTGINPFGEMAFEPWVAALPKADLHVHAEAGPRLQRLLGPGRGEAPVDWCDWAQRLMRETPPGIERLKMVASIIFRAEEDAEPANFLARVVDVLEEDAAAGSVYTEVRFGRDTVIRPDFMELFREAERVAQTRHPALRAEALATMFVGVESRVDDPRVEACLRAAGEGLAGVDLIPEPYDREADWSIAYRWAERLAGAGLGITVHAGEMAKANIRSALMVPGVRRLGHAVYAAADDGLLDAIAESGVAVECSLTSNVILGAVEDYESHPIRKFIGAGIPVTINSDDPVHFGTDIGREYGIASALGFTRDELIGVTRTAVEHGFTSDSRREELRRELDRI